MRDIKQHITGMFTEIMDLTMPITIGGLVIVLAMYETGRLDQAGWIKMTTLFYDGGIIRMWALVAGAVAAKWAESLYRRRHDAGTSSNEAGDQ